MKTRQIVAAWVLALLLSLGFVRVMSVAMDPCANLTPDNWFWWAWYGCGKDAGGGGGSGAGD